jgi:hypothetical protein
MEDPKAGALSKQRSLTPGAGSGLILQGGRELTHVYTVLSEFTDIEMSKNMFLNHRSMISMKYNCKCFDG